MNLRALPLPCTRLLFSVTKLGRAFVYPVVRPSSLAMPRSSSSPLILFNAAFSLGGDCADGRIEDGEGGRSSGGIGTNHSGEGSQETTFGG